MTSLEIAKLCGVSKTTVSRVINNDPNVKEKTRRKVQEVIDKTNYVPVASARRLAGADSNIIGLFIMDLNIGSSTVRVSKSSYFSQLANCIIDNANNAGYQVLVSILTAEQHLNQAKNIFLSRTISSGIFIGAYNEQNHLNDILELGYPIVVIDQQADIVEPSTNRLVINIDNEQGGYLATKHLIQLGHRQIGHITGDLRKLSGKDRLAGYKRALLEAGIPYDEDLIYKGEFQEEDGYRAAKVLVGERKVTGLFSSNDGMAIGAMRVVKEMGLTISEDISIIGFDNIEVGQYLSPSLTTLDAPLAQIAQYSVDQLLHYFQEGAFEAGEVTVQSELVIRESTAKVNRIKFC